MSRRGLLLDCAAKGAMAMLATMLLVLAGAEGSAERVFADYLRATAVAVRCPERAQSGEVVVCGRRRADGYRLPLEIVPDAGDPRHEGVLAERERLQAKRDNCREKSAFLIGCGMAGAGVSTGGGGTRLLAARELSP